ncbi:type III-B CRISPR-associated protein Cas10/Cmr2 [Kurthia gibsonii]|uniref:Type III-B CRISPR-associated protein Cas10/Cmr2 n=1 Tax=Kurthia gibsonii TaxID=33946 RepID=A0ABU9LMX0_9BACL
MHNSFILFTIGSVQQFIEPSRKLKDLYVGSYLLSHLAIKAKNFFENNNATIIIPTSPTDAPNRLVVSCASEKAIVLAKEAENVIQQELITIGKAVIEYTQENFTVEMEEQLKSFLDIHWVIEQEQGDFQITYKNLLQQMHRIKHTRTFVQINEKAARKCDLYEQYNGLFKQHSSLKENETLSAIAFIKRNFDRWFKSENEEPLLNVSSVAYMLLKSYLPQKAESSLLELKDEHSELLFNLKYQKTALSVDENIRQLYEEYGEYIGSPYYAIVKLDGDGIGTKYQEVNTMQQAKGLSRAISDFSKKAKKMIEEQEGICIFAGGEDILAFLPIHQIFQVLPALIKEFGQIKELNYKGTLSAGIIVSHFMTPLKPLLKEVERLESYAKAIDDEKAAFSMNTIKRSGLTTPIRMKFGEDCQNLKSLKSLVDALQQQQNSNSFVHKLIATLSEIKDVITEDMLTLLIRKQLKNSVVEEQLVEQQVSTFISIYQQVNKEMDVFLQLLEQSTFLARTMWEEKQEVNVNV